MSGKVNAVIDIKDYGIIKLELDADTAPITVTNFVNLVNSKFYDGLTFHRIIKDFMIQGGDPNHGEPTYTTSNENTIKGEFSENGIKNDISHVRGVVSMARSNDPNSASSQFFIVHQDSTFLDGKYAGFGKVIEGMEVVDKIATEVSTLATDNNGTIPYENQPVINSIAIISRES